MKFNAPRSRFLLILLALVLAALACQTVTQTFDRATATSSLSSAPTQPTLQPTTQLAEDTPIAEQPQATATPTLKPLNKGDQIAIFEELWDIVSEDYLYADFNGLDWDQIEVDYRQKIDDGLSTEDFYLAMDEMIYALNDEHSIFLNPQMVAAEEAEYAGDNDYVGIGVYISYYPEKQRAVILLTFPGGPAEQAGLKARDSVLAVEGVALDDEEGAAIDMLLGVEGTQVTITMQSPGDEEPREMTITRGRITGSLPVPREVLTTSDGKRIGYLIIPTFADSGIGVKVGEALEELTTGDPLDGIIIDNRLNSGGFDNVMSTSLGYFTSGAVGNFSNRRGDELLRVRGDDVGGSSELPLVVLVGPDTASFGEIYSGILKDQGRATLIGETTNGNVEILWGYNFDDGSRLWLAHDTFKPINNPNADWEHEGIVVDISAPAPWEEYTTATDPAILASLDFFDEQ